MSLGTLASRLSERGHREEALAAAQEAADLYRELARARPEAFTPDLAKSLNSLATSWRGSGVARMCFSIQVGPPTKSRLAL
jgi:hypothetical protein